MLAQLLAHIFEDREQHVVCCGASCYRTFHAVTFVLVVYLDLDFEFMRLFEEFLALRRQFQYTVGLYFFYEETTQTGLTYDGEQGCLVLIFGCTEVLYLVVLVADHVVGGVAVEDIDNMLGLNFSFSCTIVSRINSSSSVASMVW